MLDLCGAVGGLNYPLHPVQVAGYCLSLHGYDCDDVQVLMAAGICLSRREIQTVVEDLPFKGAEVYSEN